MKNKILSMVQIVIEIFLIPYILYKSIFSRFKNKKIDVGIGPQPLINNVYHKQALELYGYSVETFASNPFYITNKFDIVISEKYNISSLLGKFQSFMFLVNLAFKYKILYFYLNGGPLGVSTILLWRIEPFLYKLANVKTVIMPYGSDVQEMSRSNNLYFKHVMSVDYPMQKSRRTIISKKIDLWIKYGTHVISGCEWVDYMYYWDTLMLAHFSIDTNIEYKLESQNRDKRFKIFHAPNHKAIKGTKHLKNAINELIDEGYDLELVTLSNVSNEEILNTISTVDLVADQFIIGWYAMFALEAMTLEKPLMCFLREDLIDLYTNVGLIDKNEIPILNTPISKIKQNIIWAYKNRDELSEVGRKSKKYVEKHHSLNSVGNVFNKINMNIMEK